MSDQRDPAAGDGALDSRAARMFVEVLASTHLSRPDQLATILAEHAQVIGAEQLVLYLADYEQAQLVPVPGPHSGQRSVLRVQGTAGGQAFATLQIQDVSAGLPGLRRLWLPMLDGTDRVGVVEMVLVAGEGGVDRSLVAVCERFAHLVAQLVMAKGQYSDVFELVQRRQPMSIAAEMQWNLIPPRTFATDGLVVTAILEPAYHIGGDSFDYSVDSSSAQVAVFDAMGHGLRAATAATVAVATYRNCRRRQLDLSGAYATIDETLGAQFGGDRYSTAVLARLELETGSLSWVNAGHPPPLLMRGGKLVKTLETLPNTPLGVQLSKAPPHVGREALEPGDQVLFYTDGLIEARTEEGRFFTAERLAEFFERQAAAGLPAPETLRRLRNAVMTHQNGQLQDDATALLVDWRSGNEQTLLPQTVSAPSPARAG